MMPTTPAVTITPGASAANRGRAGPASKAATKPPSNAPTTHASTTISSAPIGSVPTRRAMSAVLAGSMSGGGGYSAWPANSTSMMVTKAVASPASAASKVRPMESPPVVARALSRAALSPASTA